MSPNCKPTTLSSHFAARETAKWLFAFDATINNEASHGPWHVMQDWHYMFLLWRSVKESIFVMIPLFDLSPTPMSVNPPTAQQIVDIHRRESLAIKELNSCLKVKFLV